MRGDKGVLTQKNEPMTDNPLPLPMSITAVILAGGGSRRMGTDKSLLMVEGQPMLAHVITALMPLNVPILVVTNTPESHAAFNLPMVGDFRTGLGALGGLHAALTHIRTEAALVVACDMPRLKPALLAHLINLAAVSPNSDAIVPRITGRAHPLHAVYRRHGLKTIDSQIDAGKLALNALLDRLAVHWVEESDIRPHDPDLDSFINLNTPQDLSDLPSTIA